MYIPVALILLGGLGVLVLLATAIGRSRRGDLVEPPRAIALSGALETDVHAALAEGDKIAAIKLVRDASGCGLREAKDFVEHIEASRG